MDPWGSMQNFLSQFRGFAQNPAQMMQRMGVSGDPNQIIQQMMNSGRLTQSQYNQAARAAKKIQESPQFRQMFGDSARP